MADAEPTDKALAASRGLVRLKSFIGRLPRWLAIVLLVAVVVVLLLLLIPTYQFLAHFNDAVDILTDRYGVNAFLAKALAAVLFVPLAIGVKRSFFRIGKRSLRARIATGGYAAAYFLAMYAIGRNAAFAHKTGQTLRWYAETPEGVRFFDSPGFDPKYGIALKPVDSTLMIALERRRLGQVPSPIRVEGFDQLQFFDPLSGVPRYWFYRSATGDFELFDGPGFHPRTQTLLLPLTPSVVEQITIWAGTKEAEASRGKQLALADSINAARLARAESLAASSRAFRDRYLDLAAPRSPGIKQWAVLMTDTENKQVPVLDAAGRSALGRKGIRSASPFRPQFVRDGLNDQLFGGDTALLQQLSLAELCDGIILGKMRISLSASPDAQDLTTARASLVVRLLSANTGSIIEQFELTVLGAGFSKEAAHGQATQRLADELRTRLQAALP